MPPGEVTPLRTTARRCAGTFVNDAFGPSRDWEQGHQLQNVQFVRIDDGSGFPHIFWKCFRAIPAGGTIWGDYGEDYCWESEEKAASVSILSAMMRRMLHTLRGCSAAYPLAVECE